MEVSSPNATLVAAESGPSEAPNVVSQFAFVTELMVRLNVSATVADTVTGKNIVDSTGDSGGMTENATSLWSTTSNYGFAYSCGNINGAACSLAATSQYRQFACRGTDAQCDPGTGAETATTVMLSSTATTATSRIQYKVNISAVQAAVSYSNTIVYIATPTF